MRKLVEAELPHLLRSHNAGSKDALLRALTVCLAFRYPLPEWVRAGAYAALNRYRRYEAATLDEAFGVKRSQDPRSIASKRRAYKIASKVCIHIFTQSRVFGKSLNEEFFEEVGKKFGISKTRVKEYWRKTKRGEEY